MKLHTLRIKGEYYDAIHHGDMAFVLRENNEYINYQVGDVIHFVDIDGKKFPIDHFNFNGENVYRITYILKDVEFGLDKDYCILGIKRLEEK